MTFKHLFKASLHWLNKREEIKQRSSHIYQKSHRISIEGKADIQVSAAKAFKGDPNLYNPEDLLLSSLVSCHMMSYLYVCSQNNIEVISYQDTATATLETTQDGSGRFVEANLNPQVVISDPMKIELALSLHKRANELCFIANSCNFPISHRPNCVSV